RAETTDRILMESCRDGARQNKGNVYLWVGKLQIHPQIRREYVERGLRCTVGRAVRGGWHAAQERRDVDYVPVAARLEVRNDRLHAVHRRLRINEEHFIQVGVRKLEDLPRDSTPGIVDPHVDATAQRQSLVAQPNEIFALRDVGAHISRSITTAGRGGGQ